MALTPPLRGDTHSIDEEMSSERTLLTASVAEPEDSRALIQLRTSPTLDQGVRMLGSLGDLDSALLSLLTVSVSIFLAVSFLIWADVMLSHSSLALPALRG